MTTVPPSLHPPTARASSQQSAPTMWTWEPEDKYAFPSTEAQVLARDTIGLIQTELSTVGDLLPASQAYFLLLLHKLEQTWAWIAPVRRIPFEILSTIFVMAAEQDWKAPLYIGSVCHSWRDVLLSTPQAWAFLDLRGSPKAKTILSFIRRSGHSLLHFAMPDQRGYEYCVYIVSMVTERVQCLVISQLAIGLLLEEFRNLTRLSVDLPTTKIPLDHLHVSRLPNLRYFDGSFTKAGSLIEVAAQDFPPIENMVVNTDVESAWLDAIRLCMRSLTGLHIMIGYTGTQLPTKPILLPKVKHLAIGSRGNRLLGRHWTFRAKTPVLETYSFDFEDDKHSIELDLENVTHLQCWHSVPLDIYPKIRYIRVFGAKFEGLKVIDQLRREHTLCATLEWIGLGTWQGLDMKQIARNLRRRNRETGVDLKVERIDRETSWLGDIRMSCGENMPCSAT